MVPKLLPDELLNGYLGRVGWVNRTDEIVEVFRRALEDQGVNCKGMHPVEMAAQVNDLDLETVACRHTYWAILNLVGSGSLHDQIRSGLSCHPVSVLKRSRNGAWLCTACVHEDLDYWHLSYWRRRHQIPGQFFCDKHHTPLSTVFADKALSLPPHHWLNQLEHVTSGYVSEIAKLHIARYLETFDLVTKRVGYLDRAGLCRSLRTIAGGSDRHAQRGIADIALSDMVRAQLPAWWIEHTLNIYLNLLKRRIIDSFRISVGIGGKYIATSGLILATSMLLETSEAAAHLLTQHLTCDALKETGHRGKAHSRLRAARADTSVVN